MPFSIVIQGKSFEFEGVRDGSDCSKQEILYIFFPFQFIIRLFIYHIRNQKDFSDLKLCDIRIDT